MMQTTVFSQVDGHVQLQRSEVPPWGDTDEFGGVSAELYRSPNGTSSFHLIPAGTSVPIHSGPDYAFCHIVTGRGKLVLPSGEETDYHGPELYIFEPGTLHGWRDVVEDTLLSVCLVKPASERSDG
jgi:quercetin dioxygenase-like cupin family protein